MRSVEGEGTTIDDAIARALTSLGVGRDQVEIDILWNANRGVFGFGRRKARVRATVRARLEMAPDSRFDEDEAASSAVETAVPSRDAGAHRDRPAERSTTSVEPLSRASASPAGANGAAVDAVAILKEIVSAMRLTLSVVEVGGGGGERVLRVEGPDLAIMVGRRGEVLEALEYLVNRIAERAGGAGGRVVLDATGFREQRAAGLEEHARGLAERARTRRKPVTTSALSPNDRRALHRALESESGVVARSVGRGFYRKLVIIPEGTRRGGGKAAQ